jgi:hypothetical protein
MRPRERDPKDRKAPKDLTQPSQFDLRIVFFRGMLARKFFVSSAGILKTGCSADLPPLQIVFIL